MEYHDLGELNSLALKLQRLFFQSFDLVMIEHFSIKFVVTEVSTNKFSW
jgi:hypothetical protein